MKKFINVNSRLLNNQGGRAVVGILTSFVLLPLLIIVFSSYFIFGIEVPPNYIGLRQNYIQLGFKLPLPKPYDYKISLLDKGFQNKGLEPGLHWTIPGFWKFPGVSNVILLPRDFQFINYNEERSGGELQENALDVPTSDGSKVKTDLSLIIRLYDKPDTAKEFASTKTELSEGSNIPLPVKYEGGHGGPRDLVEQFKINESSRLSKVSQIAKNELKKYLGELSTIDYYNPIARETAALKANKAINKKVSLDGIELWGTVVRRYIYSARDIDDQIFAKVLQRQTERLNAISKSLEEVKAETEKVSAEGDAKIADLLVKAEADSNLILAEGEKLEQEQKSEGDRLVAESVAGVDQKKAELLHTLSGSDVYLAREMAPLLQTLSGGVVSGFDPYDVDGWVKKLKSEGSK